MTVMTAVTAASSASMVSAAARPSADGSRLWAALMRKQSELLSAIAISGPAADAAQERFQAIRPKLEDVIDFKGLGFTYQLNRRHTARIIDIEKEWQWFLLQEGKTWFSPDPSATKAKFRAALDSIRHFRDLEAEASKISGKDSAYEHHEQLVERLCEIQDALVRMPAPDGAALLWKIEHLWHSENTCWEEEYTAQAFEDARRLLAA